VYPVVSFSTSGLTRRQTKAPAKVPKTTKAPAKPKPSASKPATKNKKPTKKVLVDIDNNPEDNSMNVDTQFDVSDNVSAPKVHAAAPAKKKTASETYTKVTPFILIVATADTRAL
jgi:DNA topoisomerase II